MRAKNSLSTKLISQKLIWWPYFFNAKKLFNSKSGMHVQNYIYIKKKTVGWNFSNLEISFLLISEKSTPDHRIFL